MRTGARIRERREALNMTSTELARRIGVTQSMISQIERGTKTVSVQLCAAISRALGCRFMDLVDLDEPDKGAVQG